MEGLNLDKFSSRSSKSGSSKALNVAEAKQRKNKKKKKSRRSSKKSLVVSQEGLKLTSDEESTSLETGEVKTFKEGYHETTNAPSTLKLPFLVSGTGMSTFNNTGLSSDLPTSAMYTLPNIKQSCNGYCRDQEMVSSLAEEMNCINMKHKQSSKNSSRSRNNIHKQNGSKQSRSSNKDKYMPKMTPLIDAVSPSIDSSSIGSVKLTNPNQLGSKSVTPNNESLRWEFALDDSEEEREHIRIYKINRRKRYLAAGQAKGLSWAMNCTVSSSFQLPDDRGLESLRVGTSSYTDYRPIKNLGISQVHGMMGASILEC